MTVNSPQSYSSISWSRRAQKRDNDDAPSTLKTNLFGFYYWSTSQMPPAGSGGRNKYLIIQKTFHQRGSFQCSIIDGLTQIITVPPKPWPLWEFAQSNTQIVQDNNTIGISTYQDMVLINTRDPRWQRLLQQLRFPTTLHKWLDFVQIFFLRFFFYLEHAEDLLLQRRPHLQEGGSLRLREEKSRPILLATSQ